jgi:hypothetical protein
MQAANSLGNMAIPMILNFVPGAGQFLSLGWMGVSAFGNTLESCKADGLNLGAAYLYSAGSAIAEVAFEKILGKILPGSQSTALGFAGVVENIFGEAREEMMQEFLDTFIMDFALMLSPQVYEAIDSDNPFLTDAQREGYVDAGFANNNYWKNYIENDFNAQAIIEAGIVAMISSGMTNISKTYNATASLIKYGNDSLIEYSNIIKNMYINQGMSKADAKIIVNNQLGQISANSINFKNRLDQMYSDSDIQKAYDLQQQEYKKNPDKYENDPKKDFDFDTFDFDGDDIVSKVAKLIYTSKG